MSPTAGYGLVRRSAGWRILNNERRPRQPQLHGQRDRLPALDTTSPAVAGGTATASFNLVRR
jgi:hypothetical protein